MGLKAWFMVQIWRFQQIAMVGSLILLVLNLGLTIYGYIDWRIRNPYIGVPAIVLTLVAIIWLAAWTWDRRLRLWREQQAVMVDRNPFAAERLSPKEMLNFEWIWLPIVEHSNPETAAKLRQWMESQYRDHPDLHNNVNEIKKKVLRRAP